MKKKTIGINPLDAYLSISTESKEVEVVEAEKREESTSSLILVGEPTPPAAPMNVSDDSAQQKKQRITLHISGDVIDRLKNAVYWEPGLTLAGFAEEALEIALNDMEAERGKPFPQRRQHRLRGGRPII